MKITLQQNKWHGDQPVEIDLPDFWDITHETMLCDQQPVLGYNEIRAKIEKQVGGKSLAELAKDKHRVVILFDDMSRPTPCQQLAEPVLDILLENGVKKDEIIFMCASGNHGALTREDFAKKLGEKIVTEYFVYNHNPYANLVKLGTSKRGFDVLLNKEVLECDLKIGLGAMIPHAANGFSGGYKIFFPGVAGIETMVHVHRGGMEAHKEFFEKNGFFKPVMGTLPEKGMRFEIEECGKMIPGDLFKVDCFTNNKSEIFEVFAGEPIATYYEAASVCGQYYKISKPDKVDVVIVNSNVKSNESNVSYGTAMQCFSGENKDGDIVLVNFAKSGQVPHFMIGHFGRTTKAPMCGGVRKDPRGKGKTIYFSPYGDMSARDEIGIESDRYIWAKTWDEVLTILSDRGPGSKVLVIDEGAIASFR